jgi:hypothetical protein
VKNNASVKRLAELAPVRDEDLAGAADAPAARALLARIVTTPVAPAQSSPHAARPGRGRTQGRRRWLAVPAVAAAVAAAALGLLWPSGDSGRSSAAAATLEMAASVARLQTPLIPGPGQFLYTKSVNAYVNTTVPAGGAGTDYNVLVPHVRQIWLGPSGGRLYEMSGTPRFLTARDRARWVADGRPKLTESPSAHTLPPSRPLDLPSDPDALYARLQHDAEGHGSGIDSEMFTLVGDSLRETSATPAQRAALYQVAARIPGVELVGRVRDSAGRPGVAVARDDHGIRFTLVFDPGNSALLSEEQVALADNTYGYPAGMRIGYATYLVQRIVNSSTATR